MVDVRLLDRHIKEDLDHFLDGAKAESMGDMLVHSPSLQPMRIPREARMFARHKHRPALPTLIVCTVALNHAELDAVRCGGQVKRSLDPWPTTGNGMPF